MIEIRSNTELVKLLRKGDVAAFDTIYNRYCNKLHQFVYMYLKQEQDADDIVQEVFVKIWESRGKINTHSSFESFLFTISYNATMSLLRRRLSNAKSKEYLKSHQQIDTSEKIIEEIQFKELNNKVQSLINHLSPRQKEIYLLSRKEGLTHKEIARKLNLSECTVNNHLVAILKNFRSHLNYSSLINGLFICLFLS